MKVKNGWVKAIPLKYYSSLHEFSPSRWMGLSWLFPKKRVWVQFDLNLRTPLSPDNKADIIFRGMDADKPVDANSCFSITKIKRWRLHIAFYASYDSFLDSIDEWHYANYLKSQKAFKEHECTTSFIEGDWSQYADKVYELYCNVAKSHHEQLFDLSYFQKIATGGSKLVCAWHGDQMIAMGILVEESSILHCTYCGLDYDHSSKSMAYSWLSFESIRLAIEAKKYEYIDVGLTADAAKRTIGFRSIPMRLDIYAKNRLVRSLLRLIGRYYSATITSEAKLKLIKKS
jgi:predicted N-acyltransferase